ncbi:MAG: endo alpha-1,4 polygalactosaminidase [Chlamydiae bacterium]|nr:endo alpha-1,4 polygalactosaminidase [Chlamydiota bacterium]
MKWLLLILIPLRLFAADAKFPWVIYYGDTAAPQLFTPYNPIIFDSERHPPLPLLLQQGKQLLGYLDLAEITVSQDLYLSLKQQGLLLEQNPDWKDSWAIDIRNPYWKKLVLNTLVPSIFAQGFTGVFLDQVDVALHLEEKNPTKYKGMAAAAADLIKEIRRKFPGKRIMLNRGYEILPLVGNQIDYLLAETLYTSYNFQDKTYFIRPEKEFTWQMGKINEARAQFPHLVVFSLDYWNPDDSKMIKTIYEKELSFCLRPYVSSPVFDKIFAEPAN